MPPARESHAELEQLENCLNWAWVFGTRKLVAQGPVTLRRAKFAVPAGKVDWTSVAEGKVTVNPGEGSAIGLAAASKVAMSVFRAVESGITLPVQLVGVSHALEVVPVHDPSAACDELVKTNELPARAKTTSGMKQLSFGFMSLVGFRLI